MFTFRLNEYLNVIELATFIFFFTQEKHKVGFCCAAINECIYL